MAPIKPPRQKLPLIKFIPNLVTIAALCSGLIAIRFAIEGDLRVAVWLIVLAAVLDGVDGRLARMLKSESEIGAELDSLVDFVNFGVAPAIVMDVWAFSGDHGTAWVSTLIYSVCCVLRLARFNVGNRTEDATREYQHFRGIPSPAGALLAMLPIYISLISPDIPEIPKAVIGAYLVVIGALMISRLPTPSFKATPVYADRATYVVIGFLAVAAALSFYPWITLTGLCLAYGVALVVTWRRISRHLRKPPHH